MLGRNDAAIKRGEELTRDHGVKTVAYKVDSKFFSSIFPYGSLLRRAVSSPEEVQKAVGDVVKDFGRIDVFVANAGELGLDAVIRISLMVAGMAISKPILEQTLEEYRKQMSVNGMYFMIFHTLRKLFTNNIFQWTE